MGGTFPQVRRLEDAAALRAHLDELGSPLPVAESVDAAGPLAQPLAHPAATLANRFCILPMEGWDATADGRPTDLVRRRWARFGSSGAALMWGGEAVAVDPAGRANPHQLAVGPDSVGDLSSLRSTLLDSHREATGGAPPVVGLQLTHSGRWSRPEGTPSPRTAYRHPILDARVGASAAQVLSDAELDALVERFVRAAVVAHEAGFDFVDVKHCHGYLLHELLTAVDRPGDYGGDLAGRTTFLRRVVEGIRADAPGLGIGVRLSVFDVIPHRAGSDGVGEPEPFDGPYRYAFGGDGTGLGVDLTETHGFCDQMVQLGIGLLCVTAGSPYYCPHVQRPAFFPPSDGYQPPNDPLVDVARLQQVTRDLTVAHPELVVVGSGLTYLQDHLPAVAQELVREGWMHAVGLGRMALSLPELPAQVLAGDPLDRRHVCRTFSDCTTAPRHGLISGCWPLDEHYKAMPERVELARIKRQARERP
jgi:2,4-dienoyl-CoA reductase-like NADH-dependent reductase (Old Yellow Enzyme family)